MPCRPLLLICYADIFFAAYYFAAMFADIFATLPLNDATISCAPFHAADCHAAAA